MWDVLLEELDVVPIMAKEAKKRLFSLFFLIVRYTILSCILSKATY